MSPRTYEDDLTAYERTHGAAENDHDLTLGTPTILGLFFVLVLVCACFFGLGYAMGHRTTPATPQVFGDATASATGAAKPAAGSAAMPDTTPVTDPSTTTTPDTSATSTPQTATVPLNGPASNPTSPAESTSAAASLAAAPARPAAASTAPQTTAAIAAGSFVVQVAAVSSQDVANILLSTLQKKGYAVAVRHEPQDQLLHVQIGPFADRKDAEAMRQRVLADGFNAIVK